MLLGAEVGACSWFSDPLERGMGSQVCTSGYAKLLEKKRETTCVETEVKMGRLTSTHPCTMHTAENARTAQNAKMG